MRDLWFKILHPHTLTLYKEFSFVRCWEYIYYQLLGSHASNCFWAAYVPQPPSVRLHRDVCVSSSYCCKLRLDVPFPWGSYSKTALESVSLTPLVAQTQLWGGYICLNHLDPSEIRHWKRYFLLYFQRPWTYLKGNATLTFGIDSYFWSFLAEL